MVISGRLKAYFGYSLIFGLGAGLLIVHIGHAIGEGENVRTFIYGILVPTLVTVGVLVGGILLWKRDVDGRYVLRVAAWSGIGAVVLAMGAVFIILYEQAEGVIMSDQVFVVANAASGGALIGLIVGIYDSRQRMAWTKTDRMRKRVTILNRVLRHDIRNKANIIQGNAEILGESLGDQRERAHTIDRQATDLVELGELARKIELLFPTEENERIDVNIGAVVERSCEQLREDYPGAAIDVSVPETAVVSAHPLIETAIANVVENAIEHNDGETPRVEIGFARVTHDGTDYVELRIADNGPGIRESEIVVLERGYETDLEHLSGLGLWLVNWVLVESEGTVRFEDNEPDGTVVSLRFECADPAKLDGTDL